MNIAILHTPRRIYGLDKQLCLFLCLMFASLQFALAEARDLKIGTIDVPPFGMLGNDGKPTGMMYEISNRIAEEAGLKFHNELLPYARTEYSLRYGSFDFVIRFSNDALPTVAYPVISVVSVPIVALANQGTPLHVLSDLHGKTVGVLRGGSFNNEFESDSAIAKYSTNDYAQMLRMMQLQRLDAVIGSNIGLYYSASLLKISPDQLSPPLLLGKREFVLHFSRKTADPETLRALKAATEKLQRSGEIDQIISKYLPGYHWKSLHIEQ